MCGMNADHLKGVSLEAGKIELAADDRSRAIVNRIPQATALREQVYAEMLC